ncbi:hypothetical protein B2J93_5368 [Marssonina coronariae]|uniref:Uncharacterized protein n=1 Tax=Diplocarpon coronariae TaxID=2795749 RepID=A0A218YZG6_9HELO|nr:hypothetical protein B2J93_5368 [Marssonina coronariae]
MPLVLTAEKSIPATTTLVDVLAPPTYYASAQQKSNTKTGWEHPTEANLPVPSQIHRLSTLDSDTSARHVHPKDFRLPGSSPHTASNAQSPPSGSLKITGATDPHNEDEDEDEGQMSSGANNEGPVSMHQGPPTPPPPTAFPPFFLNDNVMPAVTCELQTPILLLSSAKRPSKLQGHNGQFAQPRVAFLDGDGRYPAAKRLSTR